MHKPKTKKELKRKIPSYLVIPDRDASMAGEYGCQRWKMASNGGISRRAGCQLNKKRLLTTEYEHVHDLCLEQMNALLTLTHTHKRLIEEDSLHDPFVIHRYK